MNYFVHGDIADGVGMTDEFLDETGLHDILLDIVDLSMRRGCWLIELYANAILGGGEGHEGRGGMHGRTENTVVL